MKKRLKMKQSFCGYCLLLVTFLTACYEDKGTYDYEDWTALLSVSGVEIPGSAYGRVKILEGDTLKINPEIRFKAGVRPEDFDYYWVMGGDTIGRGLNLSWEITSANIRLDPSDKMAFIWLDITNRKTEESWKHYPVDVFPGGGTYYTVKVEIVPTAIPQIGAMVYEKPDGTLEWGSVKGTNPAMPENFKMLYTEMYGRYNPGKKIQGPFAGATFTGDVLSIYTRTAPDYGVMIQTNASGTYPFGNDMGTIRENTFMSDPLGKIQKKYSCYNGLQEILIGDELFVSAATSDYPYQLIEPNTLGSESGVAQITGALPDTRHVLTHVQLTTAGEAWYYTYSINMGYQRTALKDADGNSLRMDRIVGLFREPLLNAAEGQEVKFFLVGKTGTTYTLYVYVVQSYVNGTNKVTYLKEKEVTDWGGGIDENTIWFTTSSPVGWNYAYFAKGRDLWRFGYESLNQPVVAKSFDDPIVCVQPATRSGLFSRVDEDYYTAVFTWREESGESRMYAIDTRPEDITVFSACEQAIPGKVLVYLPYSSDFK